MYCDYVLGTFLIILISAFNRKLLVWERKWRVWTLSSLVLRELHGVRKSITMVVTFFIVRGHYRTQCTEHGEVNTEPNIKSPSPYNFHGLVRESCVCSSPPLIGTPLLPNNPILIREVSFGERED